MLLLASPAAAGQAPPARAMRFEHLSIEEGLSQSVVNCVLQDRSGFLWLGTQGGLNRYDGYGFEVYRHDPQDPASLAHDWILALAEDPSGDLWVGTEGGALARWRRASDDFESYRPDPKDPQSFSGLRVIALARDHSGDLWAGTMDGGLNRFDAASGGFEYFRHDPGDPTSLAHDQLGALHVDRDGILWVGTWDGLDRFDPRSGSFEHFRHDPADPASLSDPRVRAIFEDRQGRLWVGTLAGLNRLDARAGRFQRYLHDPADPGSLSHDWVRSLYQDADGRLWVGTDGGLNLWHEESAGFAGYRSDPAVAGSLLNDKIVHLYQDRGGILWLGTLGGGLARWNPGTWSFLHYANDGDDQASNMVFAISEDAAGDLWIGTFGGGLERLERSSRRRTRYTHDPGDPSSLADDRVTALLHDRDGVLWAGTVGGGLSRFDPATGRFDHQRHDPSDPGSLGADAVTALLEDRRGHLWLGTLGGGLNLRHADGTFSRYRHDPKDDTSLSGDRIFALAEDRGRHLWLATDGAGLNRLHPATSAFLRIAHQPGAGDSLSSNDLLALHADAAGRLWVGTKSSGLDLLLEIDEKTRRATFSNYSRHDGLPDDTVWGIRSDLGGKLWISTGNGLARLDPESGTVRSYSTSHGLQSGEFNQGAYFASSSGELFFGGVNGLNAFFPYRIEPGRQPSPVVLTSFARTGKPVAFERPVFEVSSVELGYRDYFFSLEVAALDFTAPEENRYRYKLEGFDDDWIDLGHRRQMTFTNLDPGRYTLRVEGANHDGVWNRDGMSLAIAVAPPPWRTWWAYGLYLLAAAAVAAGVARRHRREVELERAATRRERQIAHRQRAQAEERQRLLDERETLIEELEAKNAELERFNYTVSHDLKSPLVTIKGFLGMLKKDAAAGDVKRLEHDVRRIGAAADRMRQLLDELLELSTVGRRVKPPEEVALTAAARQALESVAGEVAAGGARVTIAAAMPVVVGERMRLVQVYQNLLANAVKYMGDQRAPRIEVGARREEDGETVLFVRDNGAGIEARYQRKVFGLFERLDAGDQGTGVGLALAKRIVEMHGGRIWVESEGLGRGSSFCFTLAGARLEGGGEAAPEGGRVVEASDRFRRSS